MNAYDYSICNNINSKTNSIDCFLIYVSSSSLFISPTNFLISHFVLITQNFGHLFVVCFLFSFFLFAFGYMFIPKCKKVH